MKEFSVPMALIDYVPVFLFLFGMTKIIDDLKDKANKALMFVLSVGTDLIVVAGLLKATYKLLYALNIGDYSWMSDQFFETQSLGFLLAGVSMVIIAVKLPKNNTYSFLPTMALVGFMIVGLGALDAGLCYIANRMKKRNALICFIISFFFILSMGYLSSRDYSEASMNWIAQGLNICGQTLFFIGTNILHKAGLKDY